MSARRFDATDVAAGAFLLAVGLFVVWETGHYPMGRTANIGPGFFPRVLGIVLALAGVGTILAALSRPAPAPVVRWRAAAAVGGALLVFALLIEPFGLVPATVALTIVARLGEPRMPLVPVIVLALALSALCVGIFVIGLDLPIAVARLP